MKITLTDPDGIKFDIEANAIDEVNGGPVTEIVLMSKERLQCKESASFVMARIIASKFGGKYGD